MARRILESFVSAICWRGKHWDCSGCQCRCHRPRIQLGPLWDPELRDLESRILAWHQGRVEELAEKVLTLEADAVVSARAFAAVQAERDHLSADLDAARGELGEALADAQALKSTLRNDEERHARQGKAWEQRGREHHDDVMRLVTARDAALNTARRLRAALEQVKAIARDDNQDVKQRAWRCGNIADRALNDRDICTGEALTDPTPKEIK